MTLKMPLGMMGKDSLYKKDSCKWNKILAEQSICKGLHLWLQIIATYHLRTKI